MAALGTGQQLVGGRAVDWGERAVTFIALGTAEIHVLSITHCTLKISFQFATRHGANSLRRWQALAEI